jgi:PTS system maltose and glucose-specific IIC component
MKSKIMKFFSDLGRSLMMPVAALAACGIILGITSALLKTQVQDAVPFLTASAAAFV